MQALTSDPNFLRISKGAYSLHCFHPEKEQLVKAPQPKEPKKVVAADTPVAAGEGGEPKEEKEVVPMVAVQAKTLEVGGQAVVQQNWEAFHEMQLHQTQHRRAASFWWCCIIGCGMRPALGMGR